MASKVDRNEVPTILKDVIHSINGPVVTVANTSSFRMMEMVHVGDAGLVGEVISVSSAATTMQVYENTTGLTIGQPVVGSGALLSVTLGPGIMKNIFDGIERPLPAMETQSGAFIATGLHVASLDEALQWDVTVKAAVGDTVKGGDIIATCPETPLIEHRSMVPPGLSGTVSWAAENGSYTITQPIIKLVDADGVEHEVCLAQRWPIKTPRPVVQREVIARPLVTGQRVIDALFPIAKGGTAAIPGGFGTGKTMTQHQLAKWSDADIVVYVGCGERGNEMTQVLEEFGELIDPKSNRPITDRTVLIANTSNMPVAAREASIYTGITIAEYFRDMGYSVALMADSTSRWAEALREMSGRLEEMPGDEGYPAYLGSRISNYYERAGQVVALGRDGRTGSITAIGAVSPPGGDMAEPVTQNTLRVVKVFWGLDATLARQRHFPAIHWLTSYSLYSDQVRAAVDRQLGMPWSEMVMEVMEILHDEARLEEVVRLIGMDSLSDKDRLKLEAAKSIREDYLQQNSFDENDSHSSLLKQAKMLENILLFAHLAAKAREAGIRYHRIMRETEDIRDRIARSKYIPEEELHRMDAVKESILQIMNGLMAKEAEAE